MADDKKTDTSADALTALQNRLNDFEIKLADAEKDRKGKSFVETAALELKVTELRAEIADLRKERAAAAGAEGKKKTKTEDKADGDNGKNQESDEFGIDALDILG